jgi:hypothetical protein
MVLSTCGLTTWLGHAIAWIGLAAAICNTKGSVIDSSVVSGTAVRITDIVSTCSIPNARKDNVPRATTCVVEVGTNVMRETILRVGIS